MFVYTYYVLINQTLALTPMIQDSVETKVFFFRRKIMKGMENITCSDTTITAILVDGGFYRRRAYLAFGDKSPEERAPRD